MGRIERTEQWISTESGENNIPQNIYMNVGYKYSELNLLASHLILDILISYDCSRVVCLNALVNISTKHSSITLKLQLRDNCHNQARFKEIF